MAEEKYVPRLKEQYYATVRDAVHVGRRCLIGAGSLVLHDIPDGGVVAEKATPLAPYDTTKALTYISI